MHYQERNGIFSQAATTFGSKQLICFRYIQKHEETAPKLIYVMSSIFTEADDFNSTTSTSGPSSSK